MEELSAFLRHMHSLGSDAPMEYMLELMCGSCPGGQMLSQVYPEGRWGHIGVDILSDTALRCYPGFCSLQSRPESHFKRADLDQWGLQDLRQEEHALVEKEVKPLPRVLVENQGTRAQNLKIT